MTIGHVYSIVAFVSILQLVLILKRSVRTKFKDTIDWGFVHLLEFFITFCVFDCLWGLCDARLPFINYFIFNYVTNSYHLLCAIAGFMWFGYIIGYLRLGKFATKVTNCLRIILLAVQVMMLIVNFFTHKSFYVTKELIYIAGPLRPYMYCAQFMYYVIILICVATKVGRKKSEEENVRYMNVFVYTLIPLAFGIGQFMMYNVAMYSMGFMLSAFVIYAYNLTDIREKNLEKVAENSTRISFVDALTGLLNRRAYEEALKLFEALGLEDSFVYVSMDLNELKLANDEQGHEAGDEILKATAEIATAVFGEYGKVYRTGGDEFVALIAADLITVDELKENFATKMNAWSGKLVKKLNISCGYVERFEVPEISLAEIAKLADERMYKEKTRYYASKGVDRRGQTEAFRILCTLYAKILKVNFTVDTYQTLSMIESEKTADFGYSDSIFKWLHDFGVSGQVYKDDVDLYLSKTSEDFLKNYFVNGNKMLSISYRRKLGDEYHDCIMEMAPASDFSPENLSCYLYVKYID